MPALTDQVSVWRMQPGGTGHALTEVAVVPCLIATLTSERRVVVTGGREVTHVVWIPHWADIRPEDELRPGRRQSPDVQGVTRRLVVDVVTRYQGIGHPNQQARCWEKIA